MHSHSHPPASWETTFPNNGPDAYRDSSARPAQHRAATAPTHLSSSGSHAVTHPRILMPGYASPQRPHNDLYFSGSSPAMKISPSYSRSNFAHPPPLPAPSLSYHSIQQQYSSPPPLHTARSFTSAPPVPPKPSPSRPRIPPKLDLYPAAVYNVSAPTLGMTSSPPSHVDSPPPIQQDHQRPAAPIDKDLTLALALSQADSGEQKKRMTQEEEDLAAAMEQSVLLGSSPLQRYIDLAVQEKATGNTQSCYVGSGIIATSPLQERPLATPSPSPSVPEMSQHSWPISTASAVVSQLLADEAYARRLAAEEEEEILRKQVSTKSAEAISRSPQGGWDLPAYSKNDNGGFPAASSQSIEDDEAFARRLAALEEEDEADFDSKHPQLQHHASAASIDGSTWSTNIPMVTPERSTEGSNLFRSDSSSSSTSYTSSSQSLPASISSRLSTSNSTIPRHPSTEQLPTQPSYSSASPARPIPTAAPSSLPPVHEIIDDPTLSPLSNQFVDVELLTGVSLGFSAPVISPQLGPLQGPIPNIISLPYGRCPPLHLQAPSWQHLLKLMARLSGTRIEATVEAIAATKFQLKLRTVVQFVKTHHSLSDWRTVLWFTIDHPVPPAMPGAQKFTNGDVNVLPFSYTLSNLPTLLRDGPETPISRAYTIPCTEATPYPTLPITFPNLAMYLQAALDESRRYVNDSSSGLRKLAKMVDICYPSLDDIHAPPERSVGGLFKRVIGRGNKANKKGRGGNEDTYLLVTPFVADDWGS